MSLTQRVDPEKRRQMVQAARAYYLEDRSKVEIAKELDISRFKVARLLTTAREIGLVKITINSDTIHEEMSEKLAQALGLRRAVVIETHGSEMDVLRTVGKAAALVLVRTLRDQEVLGLAWGRTISAMVNSLPELPRVDVVQLNGTVGSNPKDSPVELVRRFAAASHQQALALFSPFFLDDAVVAAHLREHPEIKQVLATHESLTTAVVAVGAFQPENSQALAALPHRFQQQLRGSGAVGEISGIPYTIDGTLVDDGYLEHLLGIHPAQLAKVPRVMAVASGEGKAKAVLGACRSGMVNEVVVDVSLADVLLSLVEN